MAVWIIPASNRPARQNYPKTLTAPIGQQRLEQLRNIVRLPSGDLYAWGFPRNDKNLPYLQEMAPGDICFFYIYTKGGNCYGLVARVLIVIPEEQASSASKVLWDSNEFLPYLLQRPIEIIASTDDLGASLNPSGDYMRSHPMGSMKLANEIEAAFAISEHGSIDAWAVEFIMQHAASPMSSEQSAEYFSRTTTEMRIGPLLLVDNLFLPKPKSTRISDGPGTYRAGPVKRSRQSKLVGDIGEEAVVEHLKATLHESLRASVKWLAKLGETPGWDIQYTDREGNLIKVEVKSTTCEGFQAFEMTDNEVKAAEQHRDHYHLYLVANCLSPERRQLQVVPDPVEAYSGLFMPSVYRVGR
jgi:hypothetical protein